jgi:hypothetical protein
VPAIRAVSKTESALRLTFRKARRDLREVLKPGGAFGQVPLEPAHGGALELWWAALRIQMDELERVLERKAGEVASSVLSGPMVLDD